MDSKSFHYEDLDFFDCTIESPLQEGSTWRFRVSEVTRVPLDEHGLPLAPEPLPTITLIFEGVRSIACSRAVYQADGHPGAQIEEDIFSASEGGPGAGDVFHLEGTMKNPHSWTSWRIEAGRVSIEVGDSGS